MISTIIKKEILENLLTLKFTLFTLFCVILIPLSLYFNYKSYQTRLNDYREAVRLQQEKIKTVYTRDYSEKIHRENDFILGDAGDTVNVPINVRNGKAMMVFHQIHQLMGEADFLRGLRQFYQKFCFKNASWNDLKKSFEEVCKRDLGDLFQQWLYQKGAPQFSITQASVKNDGQQFVVSAAISCQTFPSKSSSNFFPYKIDLPVVLETRRNKLNKIFPTNSSTITIHFVTDSEPIKLQIDPSHDIFRRLHSQERYLHLSQVLNDPHKIFVLPGKIETEKLKAYQQQIGYFTTTGEDTAHIEFDRAISKQDIQSHSLVLFGGIKENYLTQRFYQFLPSDIRIVHDCFIYQKHKYWKQEHAIVAVMPHPLNNEKQIILFWGISPDAILAAATEIQDYSNYAASGYRQWSCRLWLHIRLSIHHHLSAYIQL